MKFLALYNWRQIVTKMQCGPKDFTLIYLLLLKSLNNSFFLTCEDFHHWSHENYLGIDRVFDLYTGLVPCPDLLRPV